ncbi:MAG: type I DNA topoisomerase [Clostridiaceae bacterium]|nr:type I DNA topoisomerase [Clostridiaceae bacterium]
MGKTLVVVESPAKAKTIGRYLGPQYKVTASVGHIRDLPASSIGVDVKNDFKPRYITMRGKEKVIKEIKQLKEDSDQVLLATDPDREGEAIAWHLAQTLKMDENSNCRISFNEITKNSVQESLENPHPIDMDLVNAQQARRILDRLVGYELSPLLWKKIRKGLSAGRVQSVTTKIIVDREREIKAFKPEEYWLLTAYLKKQKTDPAFRVRYHGDKISGKIKKIKLNNEDRVNELILDLKDAKYIVDKITKKVSKRASKPPYTTSTLQQEASRKLGFSSSRTMRIAQQLYEGVNLSSSGQTSLITYLRTDSVRISPEAITSARNYIKNTFGTEYLPEKARYFKNKKDAQNAHECIRPTHFDLSPIKIKEQLSNEQFRLYQLIWSKFIASQMAAAVYDTVAADINANDHIFKARGENLKFPGWLKQYGIEVEDQKEDSDELDKEQLPDLAKNDELLFERLEPEQKFTTPPPRYTEASLIRVLEELGIGRPSTYAPTVYTILARKYVEKDGRSLYPTELGFLVTELLEENFTRIVETDFTANMEEQLDDVEEGKKNWIELLKQFYPDFHQSVLEAEKTIEKVEIPEVPINEKCPECNEGDLIIKEGRYGKFIACNRYPDCKYTRPIEIVVEDGKCPKCGSGILEKTTKKRRSSKFYVCDKKIDPNCDFISWDIPLDKKCDICGSYKVKKKYRGRFYEKCSNPDCESNQRKKTDSKTKSGSDISKKSKKIDIKESSQETKE